MNSCRIGAQGSQIIWSHLAHGPRKRNKYASFPYGSYLPIVTQMTGRHPHVGPRSNPKHPSWMQNCSRISNLAQATPHKFQVYCRTLRSDLKPRWAQAPRFGAKNLPTEARIILRHLNLDKNASKTNLLWSPRPMAWGQEITTLPKIKSKGVRWISTWEPRPEN